MTGDEPPDAGATDGLADGVHNEADEGTADAVADGAGPTRLLGALRDGWHGLGGGDASGCPGCPVCRLTESAGGLHPQTAAHLQSAASHVVAAGRELLAALAAEPMREPPKPPKPPKPQEATEPTEPPEARPSREQRGGSGRPGPTRIPVRTRLTEPDEGTEEQQ